MKYLYDDTTLMKIHKLFFSPCKHRRLNFHVVPQLARSIVILTFLEALILAISDVCQTIPFNKYNIEIHNQQRPQNKKKIWANEERDKTDEVNCAEHAEEIYIKVPSIRKYLAHRARHRLDTIAHCDLENLFVVSIRQKFFIVTPNWAGNGSKGREKPLQTGSKTLHK
jgi:hypothetical protein